MTFLNCQAILQTRAKRRDSIHSSSCDLIYISLFVMSIIVTKCILAWSKKLSYNIIFKILRFITLQCDNTYSAKDRFAEPMLWLYIIRSLVWNIRKSRKNWKINELCMGIILSNEIKSGKQSQVTKIEDL